MFSTPKKHQYAIRAIFELAKHAGTGPIKISEIARAQSIPQRFLEVILNQLKGSGLLKSKRGFYGGYQLLVSPERITVGEIVRCLERDAGPVACMGCESEKSCPFYGRCAFAPLWNRTREAVFGVYDHTTFRDLLDNEQELCGGGSKHTDT